MKSTVAMVLLGMSVLGAGSKNAAAQTASSTVTIFRVGGLSTLTFPGTGSSTFNFATGTQTHGGGTATGSASAGQGSITAFAAASDFGADNPDSIGSMAAHAQASLSDSFRITADTDQALKFEFGIGATGSVSTIYGADRWVGGGSSASVEWTVSLSGGPTPLSSTGKVSESYSPEFVNGVLNRKLIRTETGLSFNEFALFAEVGHGQIGQTFSLGMSALARAGYNRGPIGSTMSGTADFGSTLRWLGLRSVKFADGTPYTGAFSITSASGYDYQAQVANCPADFNSDAVVDDADFVLFVGPYNLLDCADPAMPANCPADLNNDDVVDDGDFLIFVLAYNEVVCP
jgi:hypothetical protein